MHNVLSQALNKRARTSDMRAILQILAKAPQKGFKDFQDVSYYISITIVPSYTGKYHEFVAVVLLRVRSTSNNAEGDKRVICFRYSLVLW